MIPMTSAGLSKSLNQRFFLVTRAPAAPPEGRAKRVRNAVPFQGAQNPKMPFYKGGNDDKEPQELEFSNSKYECHFL